MKYRLVKKEQLNQYEKENLELKNTISQANALIHSLLHESKENWDSWNTENESAYNNELLRNLSLLKTKIKHQTEKDAQQMWVTEGLNMVSNILRDQKNDLTTMLNNLLSHLIRYINANQGGLFLKEEQDNQDVLKLVACYAYGRRKYLNKMIFPGEGLLGQVFLENETTYLTEVPENYFTISSGCGESKPRSLIIIPLKKDENTLGVLEIASFSILSKHVIEFLNKAAEMMASSILFIKSAETSKKLLNESIQKTEQLLAQEEELRQNIEELEATQEEMQRKHKEIEQKNQLVNLIMNNLPIPLFIKDENSKYLMVNDVESEILGLPKEQIIGKDDSFFVADEKEIFLINQSDQKALYSEQPIELPLQEFTTKNGIKKFFKTIKVSFLDTLTGKKNILGISLDLTDKVLLEQKEKFNEQLKKNNILIDLAGRQRMLSQRIGFLAEIAFRNNLNKNSIDELTKTILLFEHSLDVLKNGGYPQEMEDAFHVEKAPDELKAVLTKIEILWQSVKDAAKQIIIYKQEKNSLSPDQASEAIAFLENNLDDLLKLSNQFVIELKKTLYAN
jgi:PAS domain S-box-containing protein